MADSILTREQILGTAEDMLRRFGPTKATVVDVARALDVSHGSVYRHFPSKAALRDAVTALWLARIMEPLAVVLQAETPAPQKLHAYLEQLALTKRRYAHEDPELFATYMALVSDAREVISAHVEHLVGDLATIIAEGAESGAFRGTDARGAARAVFDATSRFHNPAHAAEWRDPDIARAFDAVLELVLAGLAAPR